MLKLEYFTPNDFEQLINWIPDASFTLQWSGPSFTYPLTKQQLTDYLQDANQEKSTRYVFKVVETESNQVIGHVSINKVERLNSHARIGKVLIGASEQRSNGYGTQLMQLAAQYIFETLQLDKASLGVFDFNTAAHRCYEKIGFKQEEILLDARQFGKEYWTLIEMSLLKSEWMALRYQN